MLGVHTGMSEANPDWAAVSPIGNRLAAALSRALG